VSHGINSNVGHFYAIYLWLCVFLINRFCAILLFIVFGVILEEETEADAAITSTFFDNILTLDIIKMLTTFVKFDILALINQQSMYKSIVTTLL